MNKLEVGKVYKTIYGHNVKCLSIHLGRMQQFEALLESDSGVISYCSIDGFNPESVPFIAWPAKFKLGQLVMVRDNESGPWYVDLFESLADQNADFNFFYCKGTGWRYCRHPTEAEWIEFREGKK